MINRNSKDTEDMAELVRRVRQLESNYNILQDTLLYFLKTQHKVRDDLDAHVNTTHYNPNVFYPRTITGEDIKELERRVYKLFCSRTTIWSEF